MGEMTHKELTMLREALVAMVYGATINRSKRGGTLCRIRLRGDEGTIPFGIVHEMAQSGYIKAQDSGDILIYTITKRGEDYAISQMDNQPIRRRS